MRPKLGVPSWEMAIGSMSQSHRKGSTICHLAASAVDMVPTLATLATLAMDGSLLLPLPSIYDEAEETRHWIPVLKGWNLPWPGS